MSPHPEDAEDSSQADDEYVDMFESPLFQKLLALAEKQAAHTETLQKEALKGEQPFTRANWTHEPTWASLFKTATGKTKELTEEWMDGMDATLIFIALFLTVVTAFVVPATQALTASASGNTSPTINVSNASNIVIHINLQNGTASDSSSKPPVPSNSAQVVCLFFYLALVISLLNAVVCILGRQWARSLNKTPTGQSFLERTMRHEDRKAMARKWLEPLINSLHSSLFASIACFITGFLYQLWTVAHSFSAWAPVLAFTSALGTFLSFFVVGIIGLTILHAVLHAESPFGTPFTRAIRRLIAPWRKGNDKYAIFEKLGTEQERDAPEAIHARDEALQRGCQLVTNTTEPAFLDGASSTFLDSNWGRTWTPAFSLVNWIGAISRMLATDTSFRAKITIASFLPNFIGWLHYHKVTANVAPFVANRIDILWSLVYDLYNEVYRLSTEHEQTLFKALVGVTSLFKDNEDLAETGEHVYQDAVVGVLCSFDTDTVVGERREILRIALESFASRISSGDQSLPDFLRFRILRAILAQPYFEWTGLNVAPDLIKGIEPAALQAVSQFLSHVRHLGKLGDYQHIIEFLHFIYPSVSHTPAPVDLDLSRILELACQDAHPNQWERYSHTLMEWIEYCDVDRISDKRSLSIFLHLCAHQDWLDAKLAGISGHRQGSTDDITRERAREYLSTINDLPAVKLEEVIVGGTDVAVVVAPAPLSIAEVNNASPSKRVAIRRWPWFSERTEQPDLEDPKRD